MNERPTIPEFRGLNIDSQPSKRPKNTYKPIPGVPEKFLKKLHKDLHERTKGLKVHPNHGIVLKNFEKKTNIGIRILKKEEEEEEAGNKDEEVEEIYPKIDSKINPGDMKTLYLQNDGLDPIDTESTSNFDISIEELIPGHYKKIEVENLYRSTVHVAVPISKKDENSFANDINMQFNISQTKDEDRDLVKELFAHRQEQKDKRLKNLTKEQNKEQENHLNPGPPNTGNVNDRYVEDIGDITNMPEINLIFRL